MSIRQFVRDGVYWEVREVDASGIPGARRSTCLIFESDSAVRRVWNYDASWRDATDEALGSMLEATANATALPATGSAPVDTARAVAERARTLLAEVALAHESSSSPAVDLEHRDRADRCTRMRIDMRRAIVRYAEELRADGVPPERALVLLKSALKDGLGACDDPGDLTAEELLHEGVDWGIDAYYAA